MIRQWPYVRVIRMTDTSQDGQPSPPRLRERLAALGSRWTLLHGDRTQSPPPGADDHAREAEHRRATVPDSLWRVRTTVPDEPGTLARLCEAFAQYGVDIVSLQTSPLGLLPGAAPDVRPAERAPGKRAERPAGAPEGRASGGPRQAAREQAMDEFVLRAPADLGAEQLKTIVDGAGGSGTWAERARAQDLADTPARVLHLAARTALDSAELPLALRQLLGRCTVRSVPPGAPGEAAGSQDDPAEGTYGQTELRLPDPAGGTLVVERPWLPFTPAEFARAAALVELDRVLGTAGRVPRSEERLTLDDGRSATVQRAGPDDLRAAVEMHGRCSTATLRQRYHGPAGEADSYLRHLLSPRFGRSLAARSASGKLIALGHLLWDGDETEVALLVEDAWQRRGVGSELLRRLAELAREAGSTQMYAVTQASNTAMVSLMRKLGVPLDHQIEDGTLVVSADVSGAGAQAPAASPARALPVPEARR